MNGRVYDYNIGRFMSVDPFIHGVGNSQGINPYSYVMNNPLGYTDPSGYISKSVDDRRVGPEQLVANTFMQRPACHPSLPECQSNGSEGGASNNGANASPQNNTSPESATDIESEESKDDDFGTSRNDSGDSSKVSDGGTTMTPNYRGATAKFTDITTNDEGVVTNATITCNLSCQDESREILSGRDLAKADLSMTMMRMNMQNAHSQASEALMWVFAPVGATYSGFALRGGYKATAVALKNLGSAKRQALFAFNIEISSILNGMFHPANIMNSIVQHSLVIQSASFRYGASASNVLGKPRIRRFIKGPGKPKIKPENMGN